MRYALPDELPVLEVKLLEDRAPSVMSRVVASDYHVRIIGDTAPEVIGAIGGFLAAEEVLAVKKTKSGEKEINIRPLVLEIVPAEDGFDARLMLTERDALKADLLARVLAERAGVEAPEMRIHRKTLLGRDGTGALRPLMEL